MNPVLILYPAICMFFLTLGCILYMGYHRYTAIHKKEVRISYYQTYDKGSQPAHLHLLSRHVQNHFEVPPLFHVGVLFAYVTGTVGVGTLACAWLFFAARLVHSFIHLGHNNVSQRFFVFGFSLLCLAGLWGQVGVHLLSVS